MGLTITTASTSLVVPTSDLRDHVRGSTADNALLKSYSRAAQHYCEEFTRRSLFKQNFRLTLSGWGDVNLPRGPVVASTGSTGGVAISYLAAGSTTWTSYATGTVRLITGDYGRVVKRYNSSWPSVTLETGEAIRIDFTAGSTVANDEFRQAVRLLAGHWYANRESVQVGSVTAKLAQTVDTLLWMWRL